MKKCFSNNLLTFLEIKIMFSKRIIFVLVFVLTMFAIEANAQQDDCIDANTPPGATCGNWVQDTKSLVLGGLFYGDCEFLITYETRICQVTNGSCTQYFQQFRLLDVSWDWDAQDCWMFTHYLMPLYPNEYSGFNKTAYNAFLGDMLPELMDMIAGDFFASLTPTQKLAMQCTPPLCTMPVCTGYQLSYIATACQDRCIDYSPMGWNIIHHGSCPSDPPACCVVSAQYCWCVASSDLVRGTLTITSQANDCSGNGPLYETCYPGPGGSGVVYEPCYFGCPTIP